MSPISRTSSPQRSRITPDSRARWGCPVTPEADVGHALACRRASTKDYGFGRSAGRRLAHVTEIITEWNGYDRVGGRHGRAHQTVDHSGPKGMWAIDADGDGERVVHGNTQEGLCEVDPIVWA